MTDLGCTLDIANRLECLDWLLGQAVRLEYGDNGNYLTLTSIFFK